MRQLTFVSPGVLEWWDVAAPRLAADTDAIVRPLAVARCDLDFYIARGAQGFPGPFAMGHEAIGVVTDVGDDAGVAPGAVVIVPFQLSCGRCDNCRRGFTNTCEAYPWRAAYGLAPSSGTEFGGALSELIRVPFASHMLVPLPDGMDPIEMASAGDNIADGWRCVAPHLAARPGARVLVLGGQAKSVGLYAAGLAVSLGAGDVLYLDNNEGRRATAAQLGARTEPLGLPREPLAFDIVVNALAAAEAFSFAVASTAPNGILVQAGMMPTDAVTMPLQTLYSRGISFHTSRVSARAELPDLLAHCAHSAFRPGLVTSSVVGFSSAAEAMLDPGPKVVFRNDWEA